MKPDFNKFIGGLLEREGGYQNHPNDKGNYSCDVLAGTNRGISARFLQQVSGVCVTESDIRDLSAEQASDLFKVHFWDKMNADKFPEHDYAAIVVDHGANAGPLTAAKLLQRQLNLRGASLVEDGIIGPLTLDAISKFNQSDLYDEYREIRLNHYRTLVQNDPSLSPFLAGWENRVNKYFPAKNEKEEYSVFPILLLLAMITGVGIAIGNEIYVRSKKKKK